MAPVSGAALAGAGYWAVLSRCCGRAVVTPVFGSAAYSSAPAVNSREGQRREGEGGPDGFSVLAGAGVQPAGGGWGVQGSGLRLAPGWRGLGTGGELRPASLLTSRLQAAL